MSGFMQAIVMALPVMVFAPVGIFVMLRRRALNSVPLAPLEVAADGTTAVPVRGIYRRGAGVMGVTSNNSINPRFAIAPDGLRYRVFAEDTLPFSAIGHVEARDWFGSVHLLFVSNADPRLLSINVGNRAAANQVLNALPRMLALTPEAAKIRDGTGSAGTSGLHLYSGRFA